MFKWHTARLLDVKEITPNTRHFWLKAEGQESVGFRAGQFITLDLPISERRRERWRSYSLVNPPSADGLLELCVVRNPEGKGTAYLFDELKVGDTVTYKGPDGAFYLPKTLDFDAVFICTGTGVAPFRSMLLHIFSENIPHKNLHLIFGTRHESNILYRSEFEALAKAHPEFQYDVVLSRSEETWQGHQGYVHPIFEKQYATPRSDVRFFLCGWANMIDEATERLLGLGYEKGQVVTELYG